MFPNRLLTFLVLATFAFLNEPLFAGEKADALAKDTVELFYKAAMAKDADAIMKLADAPFWLKGIIKDRDKLKKEFQSMLEKDFSKDKLTIKMVAPLPKLEESLGKKARKRELWLDKDHRMVLVEIERGERTSRAVFAVRIKSGTAKVVGLLGDPDFD